MLANYEIAIINSKALRMGSYASFDKFFRTTSMGIPNTQNLPTATTMNIRFYLISLMLEGILLLVFAFFFVMAILRVVKKIKNSKFDPPDEDEMLSETVKEEHTMNKSESLSENKSSKSANDNLIYRFDE